MTRLSHRSLAIIVLALCAVALAAVAAPRARALSYTDVPKSHWARVAIEAVTERGPTGHKVLDDYGDVFKPEKAITRELLARSLVLASGNYGEAVKTVAVNKASVIRRSTFRSTGFSPVTSDGHGSFSRPAAHCSAASA